MKPTLARQEEVFAAALAQPKADRAAFLDRACARDLELRQRVERLLRAHDTAGDWIEPPVTLSLEEVEARPAEPAGTKIGRYTLVEKIGEGGCGTVYLAAPADLAPQRVALKIVKPGMDTREVIGRFEAERQALAMMDHPNIARVFDAGQTDTGRPFFVMEFVAGPRITDFCAQGSLSIAARLDLFIQVCRAIQHAHHKGIIHRDIKPSNILVAQHDGVPEPKVIDFGIAKAIQGRLAHPAPFTVLQQFMGTPAYVSPEQADANERDIDTRSDVYSLGVLLYELLTGRTPFDQEQLLAAGLQEMRRQICEIEPPRPSVRAKAAAPPASGGVGGGGTPIAGDLDWIVMRCLEKERARRYQTVADLAEDLRRYLHQEPVTARPPSWRYVAGKFARRHRAALAAGAAILCVLMATTAISVRMALAARRAEARAQSEAAAARQITDFLQHDLLAPTSPEQEPVWNLKMQTVLERANRNLDGRFADQPAVEASLRETLAAMYHTLGDYATEQQHLERGLALRRRLSGLDAPVTFELMTRLAAAHAGQGRYPEAEKLARASLDAERRALGPEHPATLRAMHQLAAVFWEEGRRPEAAELFKTTFDIRARVLGPEDPETLSTIQKLAEALRGYGDLVGAAFWGRRALEAKRRVLGPDNPATLIAMNGLAITLRAQEKFGESETLHRDTLAARRRTLGPEHPETLVSMTNLAFVLVDRGRFAEAEQLGLETLALKQEGLRPNHPSTLNSLTLLGLVALAQGRLEEARGRHESVLAVRRELLGPTHTDTLNSMHHLAATLRALGQWPEAATLLSQVVELRRQVLPAGHPDILRAIDELAAVQIRLAQFSAAAELLEESVDARAKKAPQAWRTYAARSELGEALMGLKDFELAERQLHMGANGLAEIADAIPATDRAVLREAPDRLARLYRVWNRPAQADRWRQKAADWAERLAAEEKK